MGKNMMLISRDIRRWRLRWGTDVNAFSINIRNDLFTPRKLASYRLTIPGTEGEQGK